MRDSKDALRREVDLLKDDLADKERELARLGTKQERREARRFEKKRGKKKKTTKPTDELLDSLVDENVVLHHGQQLPDGSIRYTLRSRFAVLVSVFVILGVIIMFAVTASTFPVWAILPMLILPAVMLGLLSGFDIQPNQQQIVLWRAWGPLRYWTRTARLRAPAVRTALENSTDSEGNSSSSYVTRLWWGEVNLRYPRGAREVESVMSEVRAVIAQARRR